MTTRTRRIVVFIGLIATIVAGLVSCGVVASSLFGRATQSSRPEPAAQPAPKSPKAYKGLGTWVDLWDARAWRDPAGAVADMESHGVKTIYIQTGNSRSTSGISNREALADFIREAHKRDMYVVAWYLPSLKAKSHDYEHVMEAIEFETSDGQRFDSFALDIESTAVKRIATRNANLAKLSARIRKAVGKDYPLGGIIPSPSGIAKQSGFWDDFPYENVANDYDVLLPMAYYTYHGNTGPQAKADAMLSMKILREQPGCERIPVHLIGGIASRSSPAEIEAFAKAARDTGCIGASIYDWAGTKPAQWRKLEAVWGAD
ncbi:MAG: hypothetical protein HGB10_06290 [Coriobacteriia bacterium]|nr:hypothetical protein [Coriobacteriia bacterium]